MAKKVFKTKLSISGIEQLKKDLLDYKNNTLPNLLKQYVEALAKEGISVGEQNVGGFGKYITFSIKTEVSEDGCKALMLASETGKIISTWKSYGEIKSAEVSPLLMAEFGSGWGAENPMQIPGVGQGTFPGQTHAFDKEGWYWLDENDNLNYSRGITAKMPMYKASIRIQEIAKKKAKEIFR